MQGAVCAVCRLLKWISLNNQTEIVQFNQLWSKVLITEKVPRFVLSYSVICLAFHNLVWGGYYSVLSTQNKPCILVIYMDTDYEGRALNKSTLWVNMDNQISLIIEYFNVNYLLKINRIGRNIQKGFLLVFYINWSNDVSVANWHNCVCPLYLETQPK